MTKIPKCYAKKFKKINFCRNKQKDAELIVRFNTTFAAIFMVAIFYIQNQEKGGI